MTRDMRPLCGETTHCPRPSRSGLGGWSTSAADVTGDVAADEFASDRVVERGSKQELFLSPRHPYTRALLDSIPPLSGSRPKRLRTIPGSPPNLLNRPSGCAFAPRCPQRFEPCSGDPELPTGDRAAACFKVPA